MVQHRLYEKVFSENQTGRGKGDVMPLNSLWVSTLILLYSVAHMDLFFTV